MNRLCPPHPRHKQDNVMKTWIITEYGNLGCDTAVSLTFKRPISRVHAKKSIRYFLDRVDRAVYGRKANRDHRHITRLCFVEGRDYEEMGHRVHYHMSVLTPKNTSPEAFRTLLETEWRMLNEAGDATFKPIDNEPGWVGYMAKDITISSTDNLDLDNTVIN